MCFLFHRSDKMSALPVFQDKPPHPPSRAQQLAIEAATHENYLASLIRLLKNKGFIALMIAYGK